MKYLLTSILVVMSLVGHTQTHLVSNPQKILFLKYKNPIVVSVNSLGPTDYFLTSNNGKVSLNEDGWYAEPRMRGEAIVSVRAKSDSAVLFQDTFHCTLFPNPDIFFDSLSNLNKQFFTKKECRTFKVLKAESPYLTIKSVFRIQGFQVTIRKGDLLAHYQNGGDTLSTEILEAFSSLEPGDKVWLDNIRVKCIDGTTRGLSSLFIVPPDDGED